MTKRAAIVVLDGVGMGAAPDAAAYGDVGSDTLGNLSRAIPGGFDLPNLQRAGLGNIAPLAGVAAERHATGAWGLMEPNSAGKDSTTGHWEIVGLHLARPFPTYPRGFPADVVDEFARLTGRGVIGNVVSSGTVVIDRFGPEHQRTGQWILYTSADSVFQIAAHEAVIPLAELYEGCRIARRMLQPPHDVSRVIARPFEGAPGAYRRTANRRDFSIEPPGETLLDALQAAGIPRHGVGKVDDLFAGRGISSRHFANNAEGLMAIADWIGGDAGGFLFANLLDFDQQFGHRNDIPGFYGALRQFDAALPGLRSALHKDDLLFITADHGNDPTTASTDHARECVPLLVLGGRVQARDLGRRSTFADLGATVSEWFGLTYRGRGTSFLAELVAA
ncbi:MAG: phosphopentomutase [Gemmatimonadetes bacterium 21-71-4]|nr:MAG: phosphopentomutase [Gemmatimonadetes bacterium 21-71-4]